MGKIVFYIWIISMLLSCCAEASQMVGSIDGSFDITLSGSAAYSIPIKIAPGSAGTEPKVQLSYDSQAPAGPVGAGWFLTGLSSITRGPKQQSIDGESGGVEFDEDDALYLDGQRIIVVAVAGAGADRRVEFRKTLDDQTRIFQIGPDLQHSYFKVQTKGGLTILLGNAENKNGAPDDSVVRFPDGTIVAFAESLAIDTAGNFIEFNYDQNGKGQYNVSHINYTGHGSLADNDVLRDDQRPYASVTFDYKNVRPLEVFTGGRSLVRDHILTDIRSCVGSSGIPKGQRCVATFDGSPNAQKQTAHYILEYSDTASANRFTLSRVRLFGQDDQTELAPTQFTYERPSYGWTTVSDTFPKSAVLAERVVAEAYRFTHFRNPASRGNDILFSYRSEAGIKSFAFKNDGLGGSSNSLWTPAPSFAPPIPFVDDLGNDLGVIVRDVNGDGRADLLQNSSVGGVTESSSYVADATKFVADPSYKLPFVVSRDGKIVASYRFGNWTGGNGSDLIFESEGISGFLRNDGPGVGWEPLGAAYKPPIAINKSLHLVDFSCGQGKPALVGTRPGVNGAPEWAVYRMGSNGWEEESDAKFKPPFAADTDPEAVRDIQIETSSGSCDGLLIATSRNGGVHDTLVAGTDGWTSRAPPGFDIVDSSGRSAGAVVGDVDGDESSDILANRVFADGSAVRYAYLWQNNGWVSAPGFIPPPMIVDAAQRSPVFFVGDLDEVRGADMVFVSETTQLPNTPAWKRGQVFTATGTGFSTHLDLTPPLAFARNDKQDLGVRFVSLHDKGLPDVIFSRSTVVNGQPTILSGAYNNTGTGWTGEPGDCTNAAQLDPNHPTGLCPPLPFAGDDITGNPVQFLDLDNDGWSDMIYSYRDKAGVLTYHAYLNVADGQNKRRWSDIETEHPDLRSLMPPAEVMPLASYGIGDMGVRFTKLDKNRVGVLVGFRAAGQQECHSDQETGVDYGCAIAPGQLKSLAYVLDGKNWTRDSRYDPPIPFVTQYDTPQGRSIDLSVQILDIAGDTLPGLVSNFTDPIIDALPWPHDPATTNKVWRNFGKGWDSNNSITLPYALDAAMREPKTIVQFTELNGDGIPDLVMTKGDCPDCSKTWLGTGAGWVERAQWKVPAAAISAQDGDPGFRIVDTKGDGYPDILYARTRTDGLIEKGLLLNNGTDFSTIGPAAAVPEFAFTSKDGIDQGARLLSVTGKGLTDIVQAFAGAQPRVYLNNSRRTDVVDTVLDGYGIKTKVFYQTLLEPDGADDRSGITEGGPLGRSAYEPASADPGLISATPSMYVVRKAEVDQGDGKIVPFYYRYGGYRIDPALLRPLGFKWRESLNTVSKSLDRTEFIQDSRISSAIRRQSTCIVDPVLLAAWPKDKDFPLDLCPEDPSIKTAWGRKVSETRNCWTVFEGSPSPPITETAFPETSECGETLQHDSVAGPTIRQTSLSKAFTTTYELDGLTISSSVTSLEYDPAGNILLRSANVKRTENRLADGSYIRTDNLYADLPDLWFLGRLSRTLVTKSRPDSGGTEEVRCSSFTYSASSGLLSSETQNCGNARSVTTNYERDKFGNLTRKITTANGEPTRATTVQFDSLGRFVEASVDVLGHSTSFSNDLVTGQPLVSTDANYLSTSFAYDPFGRLVRQVSPDMSTMQSVFIGRVDQLPTISSGASIASDIAADFGYAIKTERSGHPPSFAIFDRKGKLIRAVTDAFSTAGSTPRYVFSDTIYDLMGNATKVSLPYEVGSTPTWGFTEYDQLNRVCLTVAPDGLRTETLYRGLKQGGARVDVVADPKAQLALMSNVDDTSALLSCGHPFSSSAYRKGAQGHRTSSLLNMSKLIVQASDAKGSVNYTYDSGDRIRTMIGPTGAKTTYAYDELGNRVMVDDPDLGVWRYDYDAFGRIRSQIDAKSQISTVIYDVADRPLRRVLPDVTTEWEYDSLPHGIGQPATIKSSNGYEETFEFDALGRPYRDIVKIGSEQFVTTTEYDNLGRVSKLVYPSSLAVENHYDAKSFLIGVSDLRTGRPYWTANAIDIFGRVTAETYGNRVTTVRTFDAKSLKPLRYRSTFAGGASVLDLNLTYDIVGNVKTRADKVEGKNESFEYDELDRIKRFVRTGGRAFTYHFDPSGRMTDKTDVGTYTYVAGQRQTDGLTAKPFHGVLETRNHGITHRYAYDLNGNMIRSIDGSFEYTASNELKLAYRNDKFWSRFDYSPNGARFRQLSTRGDQTIETLYLPGFERVVDYSQPFIDDYFNPTAAAGHARTVRYRNYLSNGAGVFAVVETDNRYAHTVFDAPLTAGTTSTQETWYLHADPLGSILRITDQTGRSRAKFWYDPWGKREAKITDANAPSGGQKLGNSWNRGFSGHEHVDDFELVHMNGRVFNPTLAAFLGVDSLNQMVTDTQTGNGYLYARGNPLRLTDPFGASWLGDAWHAVTSPFRAAGDAIGAIGRGIGHFASEAGKWLSENWRTVVIIAVVIIVEVVTVGAATPAMGPLAAGILGGMAAGAVGGGLGAALYGGDFNDVLAGAIKGAVIGGISGAASAGIGQYFQVPPGQQLSTASQVGSVAAHGVVGGARSAMEGGKFWTGFAGSAASAAGSAYGPQFTSEAARTVRAGLVGGTTSALSGDKFVNGAILGAFSESFRTSVQNANSGRGSILGKIWALPNTVIGLAVGGAGYAVSYLGYALDLQENAPDISFGRNSIQFTDNASMFLGGAITLGNVEIYAGGEGSGASPLSSGWHEVQHSYQSEMLGPLYLPANVLSMGAGLIVNGDTHGSSAFMETGPGQGTRWPWQ
ncbi:RHS repeat domain-containing protein [Rhizobium sp. NZLR11]|uniref:RHS repeat domain-containing protein n=1 Tax=Rhizobium sp. NZLR11 TaxID=2731098 RepID=UPI001C833101|nr:RHS repeat-associated core domain-containing protein [Rhizobium sp. NZLR11]MBX5206830.1 hypothetical protein [Rhizobium sp. NZLR11]